MTPGHASDGVEFKERLIGMVKKEVKQVMEEAVTRKYVHEESGSVTTLCGAVEACLSQGLRRRALGLFKTSSTTALLHKVAKHCPEAAYISKKIQEIENCDPVKRSSSSSDSTSKPIFLKKNSTNSMIITSSNNNSNNSGSPAPVVKYLWIRLALYEKKLSKIIEHLVSNAIRYYDRDSLVADPDYGSILSSLLVGPCALEYSRVKTLDHFWSDPPADELIQRHRISSGHPTPPSCRRPILNFKRSLNTSSEDGSQSSFKSASSVSVAKDYVESLHQNSRATLLYGKNNVFVLPKDVSEPMPGYLSLHQTAYSLTIKWTPNQLMNGYSETDVIDKSSYWTYSLNINVDEIVYVHCHQARGDATGGTINLVGQDGVQRQPIHFPEGGHMAAFLSCLETGLLPHGRLDPPLWSHKGIGNIFPRPSKGHRRPLPSVLETPTEELPVDYVFRIVNKTNHEEFLASQPILELGRSTSPRRTQLSSSSTNESSDGSSKSMSLDATLPDSPHVLQTNQSASIALVCSTMRRQIISRAFYGWLAYCRHLSTVRTHLSGLVNGRITPECGAEDGLTKARWESLHTDNGTVTDDAEVYRLVYYGGVQHEIRKDVWPYLLGHYSFGSTSEERQGLDESSRHYYETTMSEWLAVEAIVRQRDKEKTAHAVAKLSSESGSENKIKGLDIDDDIENDVFEENGFSDLSDPDDDYNNKRNDGVENVVDNFDGVDNNKNEDDGSTAAMPEQKQQSQQTTSKPTRLNKISTDSGNVADVDVIKCDEKLNEKFTKSIDDSIIIEKDNLSNKSSLSTSSSYETVANDFVDVIEPHVIPEDSVKSFDDSNNDTLNNNNNNNNIDENRGARHSVIITDASIDIVNLQMDDDNNNSTDDKTEIQSNENDNVLSPLKEDINCSALDSLQEPKSACVSPASSNGGIYTGELLEQFGLNLHRIEKDVQRCDRNYWYFANENLDKLRNVICTYVWEHLDVGYMQGMCDLVAPLLVIFDDESLSYSCFCRLMERMIENFPNGGAMDMHFANMRSLIQILDSELYDLMHAHGDYTHFYFCYRWFLLDFKREMIYADIFSTWEVIWAAKHVASANFVLFLALALLETYRGIILTNSMDFTDVIKFFNESAEKHDTGAVLKLSRNLVLQLQTIIENK